MKHNFLRRAGALYLALVLPMAVPTAWAAPGDAFGVTLPSTLDLTVNGDPATLTATPADVPDGGTVEYIWASDDLAVAAVSSSTSDTVTVTPISQSKTPSTATITVTAVCTWEEPNPDHDPDNPDPNIPVTIQKTSGPVTATCAVTVTYIPISSLGISSSATRTLRTGETAALLPQLTFGPENASNKNVTWTTSDPTVASVSSSGTVTALKEGEATITAISEENQNVRARFALTVTDTATITVSPDSIPTLLVGDPYTLTATVTPADATITWKSNNEKIVTLSSTSGTSTTITAVGRGTTTIVATATGKNGKPITVTRTVTVGDPNSMYATSMTAQSSTSISLSAGEQTQLAVNVSPATAYVTWSSKDSSIAEVDPSTGMVTAKAPGETTTITATAQKKDNTLLTVEFKVTVTAKAESVAFVDNRNDDIESDPVLGGLYTQFDEGEGRTRTVSVEVTPSNTNTYIVWNSSDTSIVTVAANATRSTSAELTIPIARPAGQATVTATVYDSTTRQPVLGADGEPLSDKLTVVVSGITLTDSSLLLYEGEAKSLAIAHGYGEAEDADATSVRWTSSDNSVASIENGTVNASSKGTATLTATTRDGKYKASCTVTVTEDPGTIVNAGSANAGNAIKLGTSSVISQMNNIARDRAGASQMEYITGIFISPTQGVVYNSYTSDADTGSGVSMNERYYVNRATPAAEYVGALSFVPAKTFSGEARIGYVGYANGQPISGIISIKVTGLGEGNSDVTYTSNAAPVTFLADDFNAICVNRTGRTLKYVTFAPPQSSVGTLYENYANDTHPGQKVASTTQYNRNGKPNISDVTFVPAHGYSGAVKISYRAVDSNNNVTSGVVTINVNAAAGTSDPADIYYSAPQDGWATFLAADFAGASLRTIGETLSYVRFDLPNSSEGTLFYNYRSFGNYDSAVESTTSYYVSGTPSLSGVSFVPATTSSGQTAIAYTGYSTRGTTFTGTVYVGEGGTRPGTDTTYYDYTVNSGSSVNLNATAFNNAFRAAMGVDLSYIRFNSLPSSSQGTLRYRTGNSAYYNNVSTAQSFYRIGTTSSALLIGNISFLANASFTGVVRIPYTGYSANGRSYTGEITIQVNPNTIYYTGTTASSFRLSSSRISGACGTFNRPLSYIEFTGLPSDSAGRIYFNYSGYGTGTQITTGVRYYASGSPSIDQLSFVPRGRFTGDATASYTAYSTSGERMSGQIIFRISAATGSGYFTDMSNYGWAAPSVDYLYQNGVTNGMTSSTYGPSLQIRRGDFILMLYRIFNFRGGNAANPGFADVPANAYYAQAVSAAKQMGIVNGDGRNFMPNSPITRQDAMVMVKNAMEAAGKIHGSASTTILNGFPDGGSVSGYARDAVSTLVQMGAVNGSNGMLNPRMSITRAEAAVILHFVMTY